MAKSKKKKSVKAGTSKREAWEKRLKFIELLLQNGGNQTQAYKEAGFNSRTDSTACAAASRLLADAKVSAELERRRAEALDKAKLTSDEVLISMARALRFDPRKLYKDDGSMKAMQELDDDTALAIQAVEADEIVVGGKLLGITKKIKSCDRNAARDQAHKHFGHYKPLKTELTGPNGGAIQMQVMEIPDFDAAMARLLKTDGHQAGPARR